jgi:hypothetical protein
MQEIYIFKRIMTHETQGNTTLKDAFEALEAEKKKKLTEMLKAEGISDADIEKVHDEQTVKNTREKQMEAVRNALHEEYDKKTHHTREEIAQHNYIQDLKKIEKIEREFPLLETYQKALPIWKFGEILRVKKERKEMAELYAKLIRAVSDYEYKKSREELFK